LAFNSCQPFVELYSFVEQQASYFTALEGHTLTPPQIPLPHVHYPNSPWAKWGDLITGAGMVCTPASSSDEVLTVSQVANDPSLQHQLIACFLGPLRVPTIAGWVLWEAKSEMQFSVPVDSQGVSPDHLWKGRGESRIR
jgi:hypothetical protein